MEKKMPREMTGAELKSMLKSSINFKSLGGMKCEELKLSAEDKKWWRDDKIGMFVHWGLYSILGRGEWVRFNEKIPKEEYEALADEFIPQDFDMKEWVELAQDFGAKYAVMVTRHHDGFALWNSEGSYEHFTSYHRGAKRDFVQEYTDACRKAGLKVGVYYSPMDWRFPGYFDPKGLPENAALMKKQCYDQVEELCSKYHPDILWYDGGWLAHKGSDTSSAWFWEPVKLNKMARSYNPKLLINPRSGWEGDFYCDEGSHEISGKIIPVPWEKNMCVCSGCSWGWMPDDPVSDFDRLIRMMVNVVCRGGNWLVNVGPDRNGKLSDEVKNRMHEIGEWLRKYGESIYCTMAGPFEPIDNVYGSVYRENTIYLHILDTEAFRKQVLPIGAAAEKTSEEEKSEGQTAEQEENSWVDNEILSASMFDDTRVKVEKTEHGVKLQLPKMPEAPDTIVILKLRKAVEERRDAEVYFTGKE